MLLGLAYAPLWGAAASESAVFGLEGWFFIPGQFLPAPALGLAAWFSWRRLDRMRLLEVASSAGPAVLFASVGTGVFIWAYLNQTTHLLLVSLSFHLLAYGATIRGSAGLRALLLPSAVLLLGLPIPAPLENEIVWQLQLSTARDVAWILNTLGREMSLAGVLLWNESATFQVIEGCSGLRGMRILVLIALVVRELFPGAGARQLALVALAPLLAYLLNLLRVAVIVAGDHSAATSPDGDDHTMQGIAVLLAGSGILYAVGWVLASRGPTRTKRERGRETATAAPGRRRTDLRIAIAAAGFLCLLSVGIRYLRPVLATPRYSVAFSEARAGWQSENLYPSGPDRLFFGPVAWERIISRRYERSQRRPEIVDVLIVPDIASDPTTGKLFTSKISLPGADWEIRRAETGRIWSLGVDGEQLLATHGRSNGSAALVYSWRIRDRGTGRETLRALLGAEFGPFRRERPRVAIRLSTPLQHAGPLARSRAKKILDHFVISFRDDLEAL